MHEALAIPEHCQRIVELCGSESISLLALACTCRIFQGPALDLFYGSREIQLKVLIKSCLPDVYTKASEAPYKDLGSTNTKQLSDEHIWRRFDYYASKVRILKVHAAALFREVLVALSVHSRSSHIVHFPKLESLSLHELDKFEAGSIALYLPQFFVETLSRLSINCDDCFMLSFLESRVPALSRLCPNLSALKISHKCSLRDWDDEFISYLIFRIQTWREIELTVQKIMPATLASIKSIPRLERLSLRFEKLNGMSILETTNREDSVFYVGETRGLSHLQLACPPRQMHRVLQFLDCRQKTPASITLISELDKYINDSEDMFPALETHCTPLAVTHLTLSFNHAAPRLDFSDFLFLLSFRNIQELRLQGGLIIFNDRNMRSVTEAWANIRVLHFDEVQDGQLSLSCLLPLSAHCVHLEELAVNMDASSIPELSAEPFTSRNKSFERLIVGGSYIEDASAVRGFLLYAFPTIKAIITSERQTHAQEEEECLELWSKVLS